jgi:hypothetical protein
MDPNSIITRLRLLTKRALANAGLTEHESVEMAELFDALDKWIRNGGSLPASWSKDETP